ncbi:hypothetical protein GCM10025872_35200 [Barrientosiimonas endolithica]|uniref:Uncharacterized protein n=1 Tax=Barrientosiimonas endolithica TaxID=1535208 RepID=A0ABN6YRG7_9MICO|nr:hypothetical protein GCM10025872_35200 [Barrientosiimonas endolithica]
MLGARVDDVAHDDGELSLPQLGVQGQADREVSDLAPGDRAARGCGVGQIGGDELVGVVDLDRVAADEPNLLGVTAKERASELVRDLTARAEDGLRAVLHGASGGPDALLTV